jgi:hypothetical protein
MIDSSTTSFALSLWKVSFSEKIDLRLDLQGQKKNDFVSYIIISWKHADMDINIFNLGIALFQALSVLISPYYPLISLLPSDTSLQILKTYLNLEKIGFKKNRYPLYNPFVSSI